MPRVFCSWICIRKDVPRQASGLTPQYTCMRGDKFILTTLSSSEQICLDNCAVCTQRPFFEQKASLKANFSKDEVRQSLALKVKHILHTYSFIFILHIRVYTWKKISLQLLGGKPKIKVTDSHCSVQYFDRILLDSGSKSSSSYFFI